MALPDYESLMLPLLEYASDGRTSRFGDAVDALAARFKITEEELRLLLPSGRYPVFRSRVGWAKTYLTKALLLEAPNRGSFRITERGLNVLEQKPARIDDDLLARFPEFLAFKRKPGAEGVSHKRMYPFQSWDILSHRVGDGFEIAEWRFDCTWEGKRGSFDGCTIATVQNGVIETLREYMTSAPLYDWTGHWKD